MVKSRKGLVFVTCVTSGIAALLSLVSLGTQQWIVAKGKFNFVEASDKFSEIEYGLFGGVLRTDLAFITSYELTMTCLVGDNVCAMLCKTTAEGRTQELESLYNNVFVEFDQTCPKVRKSFAIPSVLKTPKQTRINNSGFLNAGCFISTVIFLIISSAMGLLAAALAVWNTASNPVQTCFTIFGIYIYNGVACGCVLLSVCIWGAEYSLNLMKNIGIFYTITGEMDTDGYANLGFSYWLNIGSLFLYIVSIFILYIRQYLVNREPEEKIELDDAPDNLMLY